MNSWPLIHGCLLDVFALKKKKRKKEEDWVSILEVFDTYGYDTHWIQMREKIGVFVHPSNKLSETNLNWSLD